MKSTITLVIATLWLGSCAEDAANAGSLGGECKLSLAPCDDGLVCRNQGCFPPIEGEVVLPKLDGRIEFIGNKTRLDADGEDRAGVRIHIFEREDEDGEIAEDDVRWAGEVRVWVEPEEAGTVVFSEGSYNADRFLVFDGTEDDMTTPVHTFIACDAQDYGCPPRALIKVAARADPLEAIVTSRTIRLVGGGTASRDGPSFDFSKGCAGGNKVLLNGDDTDEFRDSIHPGPGSYTGGTLKAERATADTVELRYEGGEADSDVSIDLAFSVRGSGSEFEVKEYEAAKRYPFEGENPGLSVSGSGRGCNRVTGKFEVFDFELDGTRLKLFNASFVQHCEGGEAALRGCVRYSR